MKRFKKNFPCPICGGYGEQQRSIGKRCGGYLSENDRYAHCMREEFSGGIPIITTSSTYAHLLDGNCNCGVSHNYLGSTTTESNNGSVIITWHDYIDENGEVLYQVGRKNPKGFTQRRPDGKGGSTYKLDNVRRVLYRLPELLAAGRDKTIYVCEGEKDCDALRKLGLIATTNSGGAEKWRDEYSEALRGRNVVILPDNDDTGRRHAQQAAQSLNGVASSVRIVELPELPDKGDVSDWLKAGGTIQQLDALAMSAPTFNVGEALSTQAIDDGWVCLADVEAEDVEWLWFPYIALGKLTLIDGDPGVGKSWATCSIASAVSNGHGLPDVPQTEPRNVLLLSAEDGLADTIRPRLNAMGANVHRITARDKGLTFDTAGLQQLEAQVTKLKPAVVIIDPLFAFVGGKVDIYRDNEVREITTRLSEIAQTNNCAIVALRHLTKQQQKALYAGGGSMAFIGAARSALLFGRDASNPDLCGFIHAKSNLAPLGEPVGYSIEKTEDGRGRFLWIDGTDLTAEKILGSVPNGKGTANTRLDEAEEFICEILKNGARLSEEISKLATKAGISSATLRRAKANLEVESFRQKSGVGAWLWQLPETQEMIADEQTPVHMNEHLQKPILTGINTTLSSDAQRHPYEHVLTGDGCSYEHVVEPSLFVINKEAIGAKADAQKDVYRAAEQVVLSSAIDVFDSIEDDWLERAAILEFDGGYSRKEAERLARLEYFKSVPIPAAA